MSDIDMLAYHRKLAERERRREQRREFYPFVRLVVFVAVLVIIMGVKW